MDRRIRKTRQAIFKAFLSLLDQVSYEQLTVQALIEVADIRNQGSSTGGRLPESV